MQIKLNGVRLSFPDLHKAKAIQEGADPKFGAAFLLDKKDDAAQIDIVRKAIWTLAKEKFGKAAKKLIEEGKLKHCLHDGAEKDYEGYGPSVMYVTASSKQRPVVVDRARAALGPEDPIPYAGCYVNTVIRLWVQDNQWGKKVNAQLQGVQFVREGEAFGAAPFDANEEFDQLDQPREKGEAPTGNGTDEDEVPF